MTKAKTIFLKTEWGTTEVPEVGEQAWYFNRFTNTWAEATVIGYGKKGGSWIVEVRLAEKPLVGSQDKWGWVDNQIRVKRGNFKPGESGRFYR